MRRANLVAAFALLLIPSGSEAARHRAVRHPADEVEIHHVFVVVMENQDYWSAIRRPFIARLAREGALLTNSHSITHPSLPNYLALVSGSTWGITDDNVRVLDGRHLGDLLDARGLSWRVYAENYPGGCFTGDYADGDLYVRRHVPFLAFRDVITDKTRCSSHIVNATQLEADVASGALPAFALFVPNDDHNGHDTSLDTADAYLESRFEPLLHDRRFTANTLFILTWDESRASSSGHIATIFWGDSVRRGAQSARHYDHYDLLRTFEETLGLGTLGREDARTGEAIRDVLLN